MAPAAQRPIFRSALACVLVLANGRDAAGGIGDEATVAGRIAGLECEHRNMRAQLQRSRQFAKGVCFDERSIGEHDQHVAHVVSSADRAASTASAVPS